MSIRKLASDFVFLTNNFTIPAITVADLYRCHWQVEFFSRWLKQHLRIKAFYGTSENAVLTRIWIALSMYVLVAIIKKASSEQSQPLHNFTDPECFTFREEAYFRDLLATARRRIGLHERQPSGIIQMLIGQP